MFLQSADQASSVLLKFICQEISKKILEDRKYCGLVGERGGFSRKFRRTGGMAGSEKRDIQWVNDLPDPSL